MAVPVISVVGNSESGKTTLIEKLIPELKKRGYRIGSIKHAREIDLEMGKDDRRHLKAGSEATVIATSGQVVLFKPIGEPNVDEIRQLLGSDLDLILCEGFKHSGLPKIEIYRKGNGAVLEGLNNVFAIVSDEQLNVKTRQFKTGDIEPIVDLLEKGFIQPNRDWLDLYVNGKQVPLTLFPRRFITEVVMAMTLSLKGIEPVKTLEIRMRKQQEGS
jgi:molybdopterin-guanine dinucleotide biosynthesis adapter protein